MSSLRCALLGLCIVAPAAHAATTATVVDLPTRPNVSQRFLHVHPDAPKANLVVISGGSGRLNLQDDGTMTTIEARCGSITRNRDAFAAAGVGLALLDLGGGPQELAGVVDYLRARDAVPVWVIGQSSGTEAAAVGAVTLPATLPIGVILTSVVGISAELARSIERPAVVMVHASDTPSYQAGLAIFANLTNTTAKEFVTMTGGSPVPGCLGPHSMDGLDAQIVERISGLIDKYAGSFGAPPATTATAVEFYNAALDHYFVTHIAGEIALLDAGTTIRGWTRTGQSFRVYANAGAGSSPVCRFYIPPDKGDSHFYGRGTAECEGTAAANPTFVNEDARFFHVVLPTAGTCPAGTRNVYRVFSNRADANHRYMVDAAIRDQMTTRGWLAEGDGPDLVVMCAPV